MTPTMPGARASQVQAAEPHAETETARARRAKDEGDDGAPRFADALERSLPGARDRHDGAAGPRRRKGRAGDHEDQAPPGAELSSVKHPHPVLRHADAQRHAADPVLAPRARLDTPELTCDGAARGSERAGAVYGTTRQRASDVAAPDAPPVAAGDVVRALPPEQRAQVLDAAGAPGVEGASATGATAGAARVAAADDVGVLLAMHSARVVVDVGAEAPLTVVVRVRDGAADVRALGPAAQALATGEVTLKRSLGEHGLDLGSFSAHDEHGSWSGQDGRRELEEHRELMAKGRASASGPAKGHTRRGLRA